MEIFIYYFQRLNQGRDELEDAMTECLVDLGCEVTGTGAGITGGNFDLIINDQIPEKEAVMKIAQMLKLLGFPDDTRIQSDNLSIFVNSVNQ